MSDRNILLRRIKSTVNAIEPSARVYLYGSRATGKGIMRPDSDWDVLILLDKQMVTNEIEEALTSPLYDLELETGEVISPMIYTEREWETKYRVTPFYSSVMSEGQLL